MLAILLITSTFTRRVQIQSNLGTTEASTIQWNLPSIHTKIVGTQYEQ